MLLSPHCCRQNMRSSLHAFTPQSNLVFLQIQKIQQNPGVCVCGEMMTGCGVMTVLFLTRPFVVSYISERMRQKCMPHKNIHMPRALGRRACVCIYVSCMWGTSTQFVLTVNICAPVVGPRLDARRVCECVELQVLL